MLPPTFFIAKLPVSQRIVLYRQWYETLRAKSEDFMSQKMHCFTQSLSIPGKVDEDTLAKIRSVFFTCVSTFSVFSVFFFFEVKKLRYWKNDPLAGGGKLSNALRHRSIGRNFSPAGPGVCRFGIGSDLNGSSSSLALLLTSLLLTCEEVHLKHHSW